MSIRRLLLVLAASPRLAPVMSKSPRKVTAFRRPSFAGRVMASEEQGQTSRVGCADSFAAPCVAKAESCRRHRVPWRSVMDPDPDGPSRSSPSSMEGLSPFKVFPGSRRARRECGRCVQALRSHRVEASGLVAAVLRPPLRLELPSQSPASARSTCRRRSRSVRLTSRRTAAASRRGALGSSPPPRGSASPLATPRSFSCKSFAIALTGRWIAPSLPFARSP